MNQSWIPRSQSEMLVTWAVILSANSLWESRASRLACLILEPRMLLTVRECAIPRAISQAPSSRTIALVGKVP